MLVEIELSVQFCSSGSQRILPIVKCTHPVKDSLGGNIGIIQLWCQVSPVGVHITLAVAPGIRVLQLGADGEQGGSLDEAGLSGKVLFKSY